MTLTLGRSPPEVSTSHEVPCQLLYSPFVLLHAVSHDSPLPATQVRPTALFLSAISACPFSTTDFNGRLEDIFHHSRLIMFFVFVLLPNFSNMVRFLRRPYSLIFAIVYDIIYLHHRGSWLGSRAPGRNGQFKPDSGGRCMLVRLSSTFTQGSTN